MANTANKSLKELAAPDLNHQPLCIDYLDLDTSFELRSGLIHLLHLNPSPILLGRPFLKTSKMKIDVDKGILTMEFDGELTKFDIFKKPIKNHALLSTNVANFVLQIPPMSEVAIKAEQRKKTLFYKPNLKAKLNGGRSLTTEKKFKERKICKLKSKFKRTNYLD